MTDAQDPCKLQQTPSLVQTVTDLHLAHFLVCLPPLAQLPTHHRPPPLNTKSHHSIAPLSSLPSSCPRRSPVPFSRRITTRPRLIKRQHDELTSPGAPRGSFARPQHFSHDRSAGGDVGCGLPHLNPSIHHLRPAHVQQDHLEAVGAW